MNSFTETILGPFLTKNSDIGSKLFTYCHKNIKSLSKKELHDCFKHSQVYLNNTQLINNYNDESIKLKLNDSITIRRDTNCIDNDRINETELEIIYCNKIANIDISGSPQISSKEHAWFALIIKPSGIKSNVGTLYHKAVCKTLKEKYNFISCEWLYHLGKNLCGIEIIANDYLSFANVRSMIIRGVIKLSYQCIICGKISNQVLEIDHSICPKLAVSVVSQHNSTSSGILSLIEITPIFQISTYNISESEYYNPLTKESHEYISYITTYVKAIKRALFKCHFPIVGDHQIVKKSKGIYACLSSVDYDGITYSMTQPYKFKKLLEREEHLYNIKQIKNQTVIESWKNGDFNNHFEEIGINDDVDNMNIPVEYMINEGYFFSLKFHLSNEVMIPKKSSEIVVSKALAIHGKHFSSEQCNVLDIGTGSGNLILSFLYNTMQFNMIGVGIDISNNALEVAKRNSINLGISERCQFHTCDFNRLIDLVNMQNCSYKYHMIICNPPYSSQKEYDRISTISRQYEPSIALFNENHPLESYNSIANSIKCCLNNDELLQRNSYFLLEVGYGQSNSVINIFKNILPEFILIEICKDYNNIDRCLVFEYK